MIATREMIVLEARTWLGTPFQHQGRLKHVAVDCVGFIVGVARHFGLPIQDRTGYNEHYMSEEELRTACEEELDPVDPGPGDVVIVLPRNRAVHLAILGWSTMIHCFDRHGVVEHGLDGIERDLSWRERIVCGYRYRGLGWDD